MNRTKHVMSAAPQIEAVIAAARGGAPRAPGGHAARSAGNGSRFLRRRGSPSVYLAWDWPYSNGPNCGFMVWRNGSQAQALLRAWWHVDTGFDEVHDYEQRALYWAVGHLEIFRNHAETLRLATLADDAGEVPSAHRANAWACASARACHD